MFGNFFRILFLLVMALILPRFLLLYAPQHHIIASYFNNINHGKLMLGFESFTEFCKQNKINLLDQQILLVTNQLSDSPNQYLQLLNQYGIRPNVAIQTSVNLILVKTNLVSKNLNEIDNIELQYNISGQVVQKADLVLVDLQNSGFVKDQALQDLLLIMQLCNIYKKKLIILDRPNPLGFLLEGPLVNILSGQLSLLLPLRYGMSLGEVASYANAQLFHNELSLVVIPLKFYLRNSFVNFEQLQKVYMSGLFEALRGTCSAEIKSDCRQNFQCLALPEYLNFSVDKWYELQAILWHNNVSVELCRYFDRKTEQYFVGVRLEINDINRVSYIKVWQDFFKFMKNAHLELHPNLYLKQIFGMAQSIELLSGNLGSESILNWMHDLRTFYKAAKPHFIYRPYPIKVKL